MKPSGLAWLARAAIACALAGSACRGGAASPAGTAEVEVPRGARSDLGAVADQIAPKAPVRPLAPEIPAVVRGPLEAGLAQYAGDRARLDAVKARVKRLEGVRTWTADVIAYGLPDGSRPVVDLLEALLLVEPLALGDGPLAEEGRGEAFTVYFLCSLVGRIGSSSIAFTQSFEAWLAAQGKTANVRAGFLDDLLAVMRERGSPLARSVGASVLRAGRPSAVVPRVLTLVASEKEMDEEYEAALPLREEVMRIPGERLLVPDWAILASAYARTLDVPRARAAAARARALLAKSAEGDRAADAKSLAASEAHVALASTIARLADATSADDRIARARAALELGLTSRAQSEFEAIRTRWPHDARARVGVARAIVRGLVARSDVSTFRAALRELEASDLDHTDGEYYELAVGLFGVRAMNELTPAAGDEERVMAGIDASFARLITLARGLAPSNPARAAVLEYLAGLVREAVTLMKSADGPFARLRRTLPEAHALRARFPDSADAIKLALAAAAFSDDAEAAFAEVEAPPAKPLAEDPDFLLDRAVLEVGLIGRFGSSGRVAAARAIVGDLAHAKVSRAEIALLEGDLATLDALLTSRAGAWAEAEQAYTRAIAVIEGEKRARALNNLAFALREQGDAAGAQRRWADAAAADKAAKLASCNAALDLASTDAGRKAARDRLTALLGEQGDACRYSARAALVAIAKADHAPAATLRSLASEAAHAADDQARGRVIFHHPASRFLHTSNTFQVAFGLKPAGSDLRRIEFPLILAIRPAVWLVVPPKIDETDVRRLARNAKD